jgi:MFS family permease
MKRFLGSFHIIQSYGILKGNARLSINLELAFGIPFNLFMFYQSLYMKNQGVTDIQIGYLISIQFLSAAFFAVFGGLITDALGRKKALFIFDLIAWPVTLMIWLVADNFWLFALAAVVNSTNQIVMIAWTCFLIEDADSVQRVAAFNLTNILSLSTGLIVPLAGVLVGYLGIAAGQRVILVFALIVMSARILVRNHFTVETRIGRQILEERKSRDKKPVKNIYRRAIERIIHSPAILTSILVSILFNIGFIACSFTNRCLYYVPYLTEVLGLDKTFISSLGTLSSVVMLLVFLFLVPMMSKNDSRVNLLTATIVQIVSFIILIMIPRGSFAMAALSTAVYFVGFGIARTYMDSMFADAAEGKERAGIYSVTNIVTSLLTAGIGPLTGLLFTYKPVMVYMVAIAILLAVAALLFHSLNTAKKRSMTAEITNKGEI